MVLDWWLLCAIRHDDEQLGASDGNQREFQTGGDDRAYRVTAEDFRGTATIRG
jgi:hypothetical protein